MVPGLILATSIELKYKCKIVLKLQLDKLNKSFFFFLRRGHNTDLRMSNAYYCETNRDFPVLKDMVVIHAVRRVRYHRYKHNKS